MSEKREGDGRKRRSSGVPHVDTKGDPRLGAFPAVDPGSIRAPSCRRENTKLILIITLVAFILKNIIFYLINT